MAIKEEDFNDVTERAIDDLGTKMLDILDKTVNKTSKDEDKIIDISIGEIKKTKFRINGRDDCIIELNLSDMGIIDRLETGYTQLREFVQDATQLESDIDDKTLVKNLNAIDRKMRSVIDFIFDSNVSDACCKGGTMLDPKDGMYRFESILECLTSLYSNNLNAEYKRMKNRVNSVAQQYIPQDHKKKQPKQKAEIKKNDE